MPLKKIDKSSKPLETKDYKNYNKEKSENFLIEIPKYTFKDIVLANQVKSKIKDIIYFKKNQEKVFNEWGLSSVIHENINKLVVNLYGPPGTGKTMAAHVIANEMKQNLLIVNYSELESKYVGETAKNIEKVFKFAKEKNLIIFFDEADAILSKRVTNMSHSTDVSVNQTRSVLLMLMNDYDGIILFATNFISNFDEAFMRRIQFHIKFELPDQKCRELLWKKYIPEKMPNNVDIHKLSYQYKGISGSDISNAVMNAAFKAARLEEEYVDEKYFFEAIQNIIKSKKENKSSTREIISEKIVTEDYVNSVLKKEER
ncbi:ATP-binding protein [Intestinibacter bartlettii]|mgnify:CR=1 FL=1|uniref:ATP-binding protein n=1 Tax=Intestinibacter bartlettii TaxID=261299 RepID=UPI00352247AF